MAAPSPSIPLSPVKWLFLFIGINCKELYLSRISPVFDQAYQKLAVNKKYALSHYARNSRHG
jgi:hypothetical protein